MLYQNNTSIMKANTKSEVMKAAWKIYRNHSVTWSQAMTKAWDCIKNGISVYLRKLYNGSVVIGYSKNGIHASLPCEVLEKVSNMKPVNNQGAALWYDGKTLNLD